MTIKTTNRTGMTLMEIMMSIMILSLGLLGILAVIPFIEYQTARIVESDFVSAVGSNAVGVIAEHQWQNPNNWLRAAGDNVYVHPGDYNNGDNACLSFQYPRLLDPFRPLIESYNPLDNHIRTWDIDPSAPNREGNGISRVFPLTNLLDWFPDLRVYSFTDNDGVAIPEKTLFFQDTFRGRDDIIYDRQENSQKRPEILIDGGKPQFTGAYSWTALMSPILGNRGENDYLYLPIPADESLSDLGLSMKVDVMVFRNRDPSSPFDSMTARVELSGTGYAGGNVTLIPFVLYDGGTVIDENPTEFQNSLESSRYLLLLGPSDDNPGVMTTRWYRIANYSREGDVFHVSLIGDTTPECWSLSTPFDGLPDANPANQVRAVLFRNLRGVFTKTIPVKN